jgi:hypothetical protein
MMPPYRHGYVAAILLLVFSHSSAAQTSRIDISGGYQITRVSDQILPIGWTADIAARLNSTWRIVAEVSRAHRTETDEELGADVTLSLSSFAAGARWSRGSSRIVPFLQVVAGAARIRARAQILDQDFGDASTKFILQPGGGVRLKVNNALGLIGQVDYRRMFFDSNDNADAAEDQWRIYGGIRISL